MRDQTARWDAERALCETVLLKKNINDIWAALELLGLKWEKGHSGRWVKKEEED